MVGAFREVGMSHGHQARIRLTGGDCKREPGGRASGHDHPVLERLAVPYQLHTVPSGDRGGLWTAADEEVTILSRGDHTEVLAAGRPHDHDLVDRRVSTQRVGGSDRGVPGHEDSDDHEGLIGLQAESGSTGSPPRRRINTKATMAPMMSRGERRFTRRVYGGDDGNQAPPTGKETFGDQI
jgi:hypothetical protein